MGLGLRVSFFFVVFKDGFCKTSVNVLRRFFGKVRCLLRRKIVFWGKFYWVLIFYLIEKGYFLEKISCCCYYY